MVGLIVLPNLYDALAMIVLCRKYLGERNAEIFCRKHNDYIQN